MTDVTQYKPGDKITLTHPDGSVLADRKVKADTKYHGGAYVDTTDAARFDPLVRLAEAGWTVTKHEPAVKLPTENGVYIVKPGDEVKGPVTFVLYEGSWRSTPPTSDAEETARYHAAKNGGLTPLRPVDEVRRETAAEVIDWMQSTNEQHPWITLDVLRDDAREHFGLVSE